MDKEFTWFPDKIYRGESQWSLFHEFAHWNEMGFYAAARAIGRGERPGINLATHSFIDFKKMTAATGLPANEIEEGLCETYLLEREHDLICRTLRYCLKCLRRGYHSPLHQLMIYETCPAHDIELKMHCPACQKLIPIEAQGYVLDSPYSCPTCRHFLWTESKNINSRYLHVIHNEAKHLLALRQRREKTSITSNLERNHNVYRRLPARAIYQFWTDMFYPNITRESIFTHGWVRLSSLADRAPWTRVSAIQEYRSIKRHLYKNYVKDHKGCLQTIETLGVAYAGLSCDQALGCPVVHAYLLWRMYWEKRVLIRDLSFDFGRHFNRLWLKETDMRQSEAIRIFVEECIASFYMLLEATNQMQQKGTCRFLTHDEIAAMGPFTANWTILRKDNQAFLHVWHWKKRPEVQPVDGDHYEAVQRSVQKVKERLIESRHMVVS